MVITGVVVCALLGSALPASASTTWRVQIVPSPANSVARLHGVSCPVRRDCIAVGISGVKGGPQVTLAERWNGLRWVIQPTPSLTGAAGLSGVSCLSATDCTAFGTQLGASDTTLVEHWDGTSWTVQPSPNPAGSRDAELVGGSCTSPASCTAVGVYVPTGVNGERPLAEFWDGTSWTIQHVPMPAGSTGANLEGGVSCPSATRCTAVGVAGPKGQLRNVPFVARWNGTAWTAHTAPIPAGATSGFFTGVSCTSPSGCTAVGDFDNASGTAVPPFADRWNGTIWTVQAVNAPDGGFLNAVSCTSGTSCTAVGDLSNTGLAEHWDGTSWTVQPTPVPENGHAHFASLMGVSCLPVTRCTAVGFFNSGRPLADHE